MNKDWKNPTYWLVVTAMIVVSTLASRYLVDLAEKELKERKLWPETE